MQFVDNIGSRPRPENPVASQMMLEHRVSRIENALVNAQLLQIPATSIVGTITAEQIDSVNAGDISGIIQAHQIGSVNAEDISGTIEARQIGTVNATSITGGITASQIVSLNASSIQGIVDASHIGNINAQNIEGFIVADQIDSLHADRITGLIIANQIGSLDGSTILANTVTAGKIAAGAIDSIHISFGALDGSTITGALIRSGNFGSRWEGDAQGLRGYALDGITKTFEISTATGLASFTGLAQLDPSSIVPSTSLTGFLGGGNLIKNSSAENDSVEDMGFTKYTLPGSSTTFNRSTDVAFHGSASFKMVAGGDSYFENGTLHPEGLMVTSTNIVRVHPGKPYVASCWIYSESGNITFDVYYRVEYTTASGKAPSTFNSRQSSNNLSPKTWTRVIGEAYTAPADAQSIAIYFISQRPLIRNEVLYFDAVQLEISDVATSYAPTGNEVIHGSIRALHIGAAQITATHIQAGAIKAQHISIVGGGSNMLHNADLEYWPTGPILGQRPDWTFYENYDSPGYFWHYDNGSTVGSSGVVEWSKVADGGPEGSNSWRLVVTTTVVSNRGFMTAYPLRLEANSTYIFSFWWKGNSPPNLPSNGGTTWQWLDVATGADLVNGEGSVSPTPASTTEWKRYACRIKFDSLGGRLTYQGASGYDYVYISPANLIIDGFTPNNIDVETAMWQYERGDFLTGFSLRPGDIMPYSLGPTQLTPNGITTDQIKTRSILAQSIAVDTITGTEIAANSIGANEIAASSIRSNHLTATAIDGMTITGATIRTKEIGNLRVELTSTAGIVFYKADNTAGLSLSNTGGLQSGPAGAPRSILDGASLRFEEDTIGTVAVSLSPTSGLDLLMGNNLTGSDTRDITWKSATVTALSFGARITTYETENVIANGIGIRRASVDTLNRRVSSGPSGFKTTADSSLVSEVKTNNQASSLATARILSYSELHEDGTSYGRPRSYISPQSTHTDPSHTIPGITHILLDSYRTSHWRLPQFNKRITDAPGGYWFVSGSEGVSAPVDSTRFSGSFSVFDTSCVVWFVLSSTGVITGAAGTLIFDVVIDGNTGTPYRRVKRMWAASADDSFTMEFSATGLARGNHTFDLWWSRSGGTEMRMYGTSNQPTHWYGGVWTSLATTT